MTRGVCSYNPWRSSLRQAGVEAHRRRRQFKRALDGSGIGIVAIERFDMLVTSVVSVPVLTSAQTVDGAQTNNQADYFDIRPP